MTSSVPPKTSETELASHRCILAVNDNDDELFLIARHLGKSFPAAKILSASNGAQALEIWRRETIHAIVTDNKMPHVTGIMLVRQIRETGSDVPIIMATGSDRYRDEALRAGVNVFYTDSALEGITEALKTCFGE